MEPSQHNISQQEPDLKDQLLLFLAALKHKSILFLFILTLLLGLVAVRHLLYVDTESVLTGTILLFVSFAIILNRLPLLQSTPLSPHKQGAWALLFISFVAAILSFTPSSYAFVLTLFSGLGFVIACLLFGWGFAFLKKLILPVFVLVIGIPILLHYSTVLGFPFRIASAHFASLLLSLFGIPCSVDGTVLMISDHSISVSAACSGIVLFQTLIWIAWVLILNFQPPGWDRLLHFLVIFPIVIIGNTLRVILLVLAYLFIDQGILDTHWHERIGYITVAISILLFYGLQIITQDAPNTTPS